VRKEIRLLQSKPMKMAKAAAFLRHKPLSSLKGKSPNASQPMFARDVGWFMLPVKSGLKKGKSDADI
jgi:hypothetical protein